MIPPASLTSSPWWPAIGAPIANHLWQSTLFAVVAGLLTLLLQKNHARTRYTLWLLASAKFLLPFSLLILLGSHLGHPQARLILPSNFTFALQELGQPFAPSNSISPTPALPKAPATAAHLFPIVLLLIWLCGSIAVLLVWLLRWHRLAAASPRRVSPVTSGRELAALLRTQHGAGISRPIPLVLSPSTLEPGILGIFRPLLLLPTGISEHLTDAQLDAILAHELCHLRRRDNLAAALHMLVEGLFWFHPLLWWIGARLVDERERACDEHVLTLGADPQTYAEAILKVCKFYLESPLFCAAGVTGSNLKKRIEAIMMHSAARPLSLGKKLLLAAAGTAAALVPLAFGVVHAAQSGPNSHAPQIVTTSFYNPPPLRAYESVSIRPSNATPSASPAAEFRPDGFSATNVTVQMLIRQAYGVDDYQIAGGPAWLNRDRYDVEAEVSDSVTEELRKGDVNQLAAEQQPMLLELLADSFHLSVHRETREIPAYALVISESGSKVHAAAPGDTYPNGIKDANGNGHGGIMSFHRGRLIGQGISLDFLARELSHELGRPVLERTGLAGTYDFTLHWSDGRLMASEYVVESRRPGAKPEAPRLDPPAQSDEVSGPSIFAALHDQLGLELIESTEKSSPAQILVIDSAEPASAYDTVSSNQPQSQPALAFASVYLKANTTDTPMTGFNIKGKPFRAAMFKPDRFMATNVTLHDLVRMAYSVTDSELIGGADWINSEKYDVDARIGNATVDELSKLNPDQGSQQRRNMIQALLAEHFKLATHRETRTLSVYMLTVAATGSKLQLAKPSDTYANGPKGLGNSPAGPGHWEAEHGKELFQGMPISSLVQFLSNRLHRIVLDKTGLDANYDFTLQWTPIPPETSSPSILSAVHDQLGLQLARQDSPVEVLVIDHAEQPSQD